MVCGFVPMSARMQERAIIQYTRMWLSTTLQVLDIISEQTSERHILHRNSKPKIVQFNVSNNFKDTSRRLSSMSRQYRWIAIIFGWLLILILSLYLAFTFLFKINRQLGFAYRIHTFWRIMLFFPSMETKSWKFQNDTLINMRFIIISQKVAKLGLRKLQICSI